jgi:branched-chain amino acid transport system substrate-binding protein
VSQLDRRQALKLFASVGATAIGGSALTACDSAATTSQTANLPPVKIGVIVPQTGVLKSDGDELSNGFRLYMKRSGGMLGGRTANVVYIDEGESPTSGKAALDTLLKKENVLAISGVVSSGVMTAIRDTVEQAQIPLVGSNASPSTLQGVKYIWRTSWSATDPGRALGKYVADFVGRGGRVATMAPDYAAGHDFVGGFKEAFIAADGNQDLLQLWTKFTPPQTNFETELSQIASSDVTAVFCFYAGTFASEFVKQFSRLKVRRKLFACGFLTEGAPLKNEGKDALGIQTSMNYSPDLDNQANRIFAADYHKEYNQAPTTFAMAAFDAAYVLDKAIGMAGTDLTPVTLNSAIARVGQIPSPRGAWEFSQNRTPLQKWYLREVRYDGPVLSNVVLSELVTL